MVMEILTILFNCQEMFQADSEFSGKPSIMGNECTLKICKNICVRLVFKNFNHTLHADSL